MELYCCECNTSDTLYLKYFYSDNELQAQKIAKDWVGWFKDSRIIHTMVRKVSQQELFSLTAL